MEHPFYKKSKREQRHFQIGLTLVAVLVILASIFISWLTEIYSIGILTFSISLSIIAPFLDTPTMKASGQLIYHSPLFISEKLKNGVINIHGGTLFDYWLVIDKKMNGTRRTQFILQQYLQGLLNLIETYEHTEEMGVKVRGTSYIINQRTAEKLGFESVQVDFIQYIILVFNYFNLLISNSIAKNKLSFPSLKHIETFESTLQDLTERKAFIESLNQKLKQTNKTN